VTPRHALKIVAAFAIAAITMLMWSDSAVGWFHAFLSNVKRTGSEAATVLRHRPQGDLDLHVAMWGVGASLMVASIAASWRRYVALVGLLTWSVVVESLQPVFTEVRMFQVTDLLGNAIGVSLVAAGVAVVHARARHGSDSHHSRGVTS